MQTRIMKAVWVGLALAAVAVAGCAEVTDDGSMEEGMPAAGTRPPALSSDGAGDQTVDKIESALRLTQLSDGFESNRGNWFFDGVGNNSTAHFFENSALARTGTYSAFLWTRGNAWRSVGRQVTITGWTNANRGTCSLGFYLRSDIDFGADVNIEVIDPVTWTYVALYKTSVFGHHAYEFQSTPSWSASRNQVFVRVAAGAGLRTAVNKREERLFVDDMVMSCVFN